MIPQKITSIDNFSLPLLLKNGATQEKLDLTGLNLNSDSIKYICESIQENNCLTSLDLSCNQFDLKSSNHLFELLDKNHTLKSLSLRYTEIGKIQESKYLSEALKTNRNLTAIDLSFNYFDKESSKKLFESLKYNFALISLDLSNNRIDAKSLGNFFLFHSLLIRFW